MSSTEETPREWCARQLTEVDPDGTVVTRFALQAREGNKWVSFARVFPPKSSSNIHAAADELHDSIEREVLNSQHKHVRVAAWPERGKHWVSTKVWPVLIDEDEEEFAAESMGDLNLRGYAMTLQQNQFLHRQNTLATGKVIGLLMTQLDRANETADNLRAEKANFSKVKEDLLDRGLDRQLKAQQQNTLANAANAIISGLQWKFNGGQRPQGGDDLVKAVTSLIDSLTPEQLTDFAATGALNFNVAQQQAVAVLLSASTKDDTGGDTPALPEPVPDTGEPAPLPQQKSATRDPVAVAPEMLRALREQLSDGQYADALGQLNKAVGLLRDPLAALAPPDDGDTDADAGPDIEETDPSISANDGADASNTADSETAPEEETIP